MRSGSRLIQANECGVGWSTSTARSTTTVERTRDNVTPQLMREQLNATTMTGTRIQNTRQRNTTTLPQSAQSRSKLHEHETGTTTPRQARTPRHGERALSRGGSWQDWGIDTTDPSTRQDYQAIEPRRHPYAESTAWHEEKARNNNDTPNMPITQKRPAGATEVHSQPGTPGGTHAVDSHSAKRRKRRRQTSEGTTGPARTDTEQKRQAATMYNRSRHTPPTDEEGSAMQHEDSLGWCDKKQQRRQNRGAPKAPRRQTRDQEHRRIPTCTMPRDATLQVQPQTRSGSTSHGPKTSQRAKPGRRSRSSTSTEPCIYGHAPTTLR